MAFRFNFTGLDLDLDDVDVDDDAQGTSTESDVGGNTPAEFAPSSKFDVLSLAATLPHLLQADVVRIPLVADVMYKRSLTDVKFQAAQEDDLAANDGMPRVFELVEKSDLVKGVYEGEKWFQDLGMFHRLGPISRDKYPRRLSRRQTSPRAWLWLLSPWDPPPPPLANHDRRLPGLQRTRPLARYRPKCYHQHHLPARSAGCLWGGHCPGRGRRRAARGEDERGPGVRGEEKQDVCRGLGGAGGG
ncbi:hypothetical protein BC938DRAFT_472415 [Jimgerdemannia flammicorona]|uniref:Uncharacterized protein n=1 Tax=Jimgerdemannia flammicorona TaxID=994334 RepID=A0A433Q662_9FUNG|nr:hypothetical protein BC938DRAFT_472415 [Jimgerdemannia flammicorona]